MPAAICHLQSVLTARDVSVNLLPLYDMIKMQIERLILGAYQTNCYILHKKAGQDCLLIDAGLQSGELVSFLQAHKLNPVALVLTHGHIDHVAGIAVLRKNFPDIKVYIHKLDAKILIPGEKREAASVQCSAFVQQGDVINAAGIELQVLHTPGHTPGGICLYSKKHRIVFTDDTLFAQSVGRTDLPGGSMAQLINSIREKLFVLPDDTVVYPGHGPVTTIGQEKANNQYLQ